MRKARSLSIHSLVLVCAAISAISLFAAGQVDSFYTSLFEKAQKSFLARNYEAAARDFAVAAFGLAGDKSLRAKAYVYLSISQYRLKEVSASEKSMHEAAALLGEEGLYELEILEAARPDFERLMSIFGLAQAQYEPLPKEADEPKPNTEPNPGPPAAAKKSGENATAAAKPAPDSSPPEKSGFRLDEIKEGDLIPVEFVETLPVVLRRVQPIYPTYAGARAVEGTVSVNALVSEKGTVIKAEIKKGMKERLGFDQAALRAVLQWKFEPATVKGIRVKVWMPISINFRKKPAVPAP